MLRASNKGKYVPVDIDPTTLLTTSIPPTDSGTREQVVVSSHRASWATTGRGGSFRASPLSEIQSQSGPYPTTPTSAFGVPNTIQVSANVVTNPDIQQQRTMHAPVEVAAGLNMSMSVSPKGVKLILKENVRAYIFRNVKFWDRDEHGVFSEEPNTVCGIVLRLCNVLACNHEILAPTWWRETKPLVIKTHTDQRNNCIKTVHIRYKEVVKAALADTSTQSSSMLLSQYLGGTNAHFTYLMGLRNNSTHYLQLVDVFAPCLVGKFLWNNDTAMARMCSSLHQHEFDNLFSVSDEAFVLLLIDNYAARWVAEATLQTQLGVETLTEEQEATLPKGKRNNGGGSGWSDHGHQRYNALYRVVQRDRRQRGLAFNRELLKVFQDRRARERKHAVPPSTKKRKTLAFDDLNPPEVGDDEDLLAFLLPDNVTSV